MSATVTIDSLTRQIEDSLLVIAGLTRLTPVIQEACELVIHALEEGCKVLTAGNGGSAAEALHMAEELIGRFRTNRRSLPGIALCADPTALTCIGNDFGYDALFSRQVEGLGCPGDVLVLFSTSGRPVNLIAAAEAARARDMRVLCLTGRDGGPLAERGDCSVIVSGAATERIQEAHQVILHLILDAVEQAFSVQEPA